jgi:hypothetical protein
MVRTTVLSSRLEERQSARLARKARQLGRTPSEIGAMLIDEGLRRDEFAFIDFRDSPVGRQAYIQGSTLALWEIVWVARSYRESVTKTAKHLRLSELKVKAALEYWKHYSEEIEQAIRDFEEVSSFEELRKTLPQSEIFPPEK